MQNPLKEETEKEKKRYVKRYIHEKDYWAVLNYIFTGKMVDMSWLKDTQ